VAFPLIIIFENYFSSLRMTSAYEVREVASIHKERAVLYLQQDLRECRDWMRTCALLHQYLPDEAKPLLNQSCTCTGLEVLALDAVVQDGKYN
jgi:hypothetical protein